MTPDQLVEQYLNLARKHAHAATRKHRISYDDAYAAALVGLWQAAQRFEPGRCSFMFYAIPRIRGEIVDWIRSTGEHSRSDARARTGVLTVSLDEPDRPGNDRDRNDTVSVRGSDTDYVDLTCTVTSTLAELKPRDRRIVAAYIDGAKMAEIGAAVGLTEPRVSQIVNGFRDRLRRQLACV